MESFSEHIQIFSRNAAGKNLQKTLYFLKSKLISLIFETYYQGKIFSYKEKKQLDLKVLRISTFEAKLIIFLHILQVLT